MITKGLYTLPAASSERLCCCILSKYLTTNLIVSDLEVMIVFKNVHTHHFPMF